MKTWLEITYDGRSPERHKLAPAGATLGKHARAAISLPAADALHGEHLKLTPRVDGCLVEQLETDGVGMTFHGRPLTRGLVPWGEELFVGDMHLRLVREEARVDDERTNPLVIALVVVGLALAGYSEYQKRLGQVAVTEAPPVPAMTIAVADCSYAGEAAAHRAQVLGERAHAKRMRAPFSAADAVASLDLLGQAEACLRKAGLEVEAKQAQAELAVWRKRTDEVWRGHLLRLERALRNNESKVIIEEAQSLSAMVPTKTPYSDWLAAITRRHELALKQQDPSAPGAGS